MLGSSNTVLYTDATRELYRTSAELLAQPVSENCREVKGEVRAENRGGMRVAFPTGQVGKDLRALWPRHETGEVGYSLGNHRRKTVRLSIDGSELGPQTPREHCSASLGQLGCGRGGGTVEKSVITEFLKLAGTSRWGGCSMWRNTATCWTSRSHWRRSKTWARTGSGV